MADEIPNVDNLPNKSGSIKKIAKRGRPSKFEKAREIEALKSFGNPAAFSRSAPTMGKQSKENITDTVLGNARVLNYVPKIKVYQIYFKDSQRSQLDGAMEPFNNCGRTSQLLEYDVFKRLYSTSQIKEFDYWGAVSWKFSKVMGFGGTSLINFINKNPGYDVYFCHPNVGIEALYENPWIQGGVSHPDFIEISKAFLTAAGLDSSLVSKVIPSGFVASANYFVANKRFWDAYIDFVDGVLKKVDLNLDESIKAELLSAVADSRGLHHGACYLPFIIERLFGEFLMMNIGRFKAFKLKSPKLEATMTEHHHSLRAMKDIAVKTKSEWLLNCWRTYRNLYMETTYGKEAIEPYRSLFNPPSIKFADIALYY